MFLLNSRLGLFSAASFEAPLLPKLRGHFAEFLNNASPARLRILSSSTCVGLRYGYLIQFLLAFLVSVILGISLLLFHYAFQHKLFLLLASLPLLRPQHLLSISVVQESLPAIHRLRFSASP